MQFRRRAVADEIDQQEAHTSPRRVHWWKLLGVVVLVLIVALVIVHAIWSRTEGKRLEAQAAAYRAAGERIELSDFEIDDIPAGKNAATEIDAAAAVEQFNWPAELDPEFPLRPDEVKALRSAATANAPALAHLAAAATRPAAAWPLHLSSPVLLQMLPNLNHQRELAVLLKFDAMRAHHDGDDARALRRVAQIMALARALDDQPMLVTHLVSLGVRDIAAYLAGNLAADLRIGAARGDAPPAQVRDLIRTLLNDAPQRHGQRMALLGERAMQLDSARAMARGTLTLGSPGAGVGGMPAKGGPGAGAGAGIGFIHYLIKPTILGDGVLMMRHTTDLLHAAAAAPNWPAFQQTAPNWPSNVSARPWRHLMASMLMPSLKRAIETDFRLMTDRRLAATALAARWYAADHAGKLPARLEDLVPGYLDAVPLDPMASAGVLKYVRDAEAADHAQPSGATTGPIEIKPPIVYSVGANGVDDGGSDFAASKRADAGRWQRLDAVVHLTRQPRPPREIESDGVGDLTLPPAPPATVPATPPAPASHITPQRAG
jgi:hypothetical protein